MTHDIGQEAIGESAREQRQSEADRRSSLRKERRCSQGWAGAAAEAETIFDGATKDTLRKAEALEKHVKTVTMRSESLATTEANFFKTLLDPLHTMKHCAVETKS